MVLRYPLALELPTPRLLQTVLLVLVVPQTLVVLMVPENQPVPTDRSYQQDLKVLVVRSVH